MSVETTNFLRDLKDLVRERQNEVVSRIRSVVEAESPSGYETGSRKVVSLLEQQARSLDSVSLITRIPVPEYGEHLRIELRGNATAEEKPLLLLGHTDTVHAVGSLALRPWRVEEGRIYAPGIFDMKASCVMALETIAAMEKLGIPLSSPVIIMLMCDEETGSENGRAHVEEAARQSRAVLVLESQA